MAKKVYVGNLGPKADSISLTALFSIFGKVVRAYIVNDRKTGENKGYGFVEMSTDDEAQAAIKALDGKDCDGFTVEVSEAKTER